MVYSLHMIERKDILQDIHKAIKRGRIVSLLGPRQSGKTTLARNFAQPGSSTYFDLEDPVVRLIVTSRSNGARSAHTPQSAIPNEGIIVLTVWMSVLSDDVVNSFPP